MVWPILISLAVTPGASAAVAGSANAMSAAAANQALFAYIVIPSPLLKQLRNRLVRRPLAHHPSEACGRGADDTGRSHGHEIHAGDEHHAVDHLGRRDGLRCEAGDALGNIGHVLHEDRARQGTADRGDAADDAADEE